MGRSGCVHVFMHIHSECSEFDETVHFRSSDFRSEQYSWRAEKQVERKDIVQEAASTGTFEPEHLEAKHLLQRQSTLLVGTDGSNSEVAQFRTAIRTLLWCRFRGRYMHLARFTSSACGCVLVNKILLRTFSLAVWSHGIKLISHINNICKIWIMTKSWII